MRPEQPALAISVRHAESGDYEAMHRILSGPRAVWGTLQLPFQPKELWSKRLSNPQPGQYSLVACAGDEIVGQLGLHTLAERPRRRHVGQLGMAVRDDWHGRGVGSALLQAAVDLADRWLNLRRLELEVYTDNAPAIALYKKFGFVIEGTQLDYGFRDGQYVDSYMMARIYRGSGG